MCKILRTLAFAGLWGGLIIAFCSIVILFVLAPYAVAGYLIVKLLEILT